MLLIFASISNGRRGRRKNFLDVTLRGGIGILSADSDVKRVAAGNSRNEVRFADPFVGGFVETAGARIGDFYVGAFFLLPKKIDLTPFGIRSGTLERHASFGVVFHGK